MAEGRILLPFALGIDLGAILVSRLREVKIIARGVVRAIAGERPVARPLHDLDVGIFLGDLGADLVEIRNLDAEMVEASLTAASARDQRHAEIAVADRDRADLPRRIARRLQSEGGTVEHTEQRVVVAGNGEMVELREHRPSPAI